MFNHSLSNREQAVSPQTMSKPHSEEQGSALQNWQQLDTLQLGNDKHNNNTPAGVSQFPLKRKQRASAQDWFEERQSQKLKAVATGSNGVQLGNAALPASEPNSRNPRSRFTEQAAPLLQNTPPQPHQPYSHTHPDSNQAHSPTTDQNPSSTATSSKMPNWRSERYNRRDYGDAGRRSPSRDPRINHNQDRRQSYPYPQPPPPPPPPPRSTIRRSSIDHGNYGRRSPPLNRREEDRDWTRDHREHRGGPDVSNAPTGPRVAGQKQMPPGPHKPNQPTFQSYPKQQGSQPRALDPRLAGQTDTMPRSGHIDEGTSASAMEVDLANTLEGGSGTRSGSRTPNTPNTPVFVPPKQKTELHSVLLEFSNRTLQLSSLDMKREAAAKELGRQIQAFDHSRRFHEKFPSLSEQQANNKARAQKDLDGLNRRYKEEDSARNRIIEAIASRVTSGSASTIESEYIRRLEKELSEVKSQFSSHGQIQMGFVDIRNQLRSLKQRPNELVGLTNRVDRIQNRLDEFPNLRLDVDKMREELRKITTLLDTQITAFTKLKNTVDGADDTGGLLQFVAEAEQTGNQLALALNQAHTDMDDFEKKVDSIQKEWDKLKSEGVAGVFVGGSAGGKGAMVFDQSAVEKVQREVSDLRARMDSSRADVADLIADQSERDGAILEEIEKVTNMSEENSANLESGLGEVRRDYSEAIMRLESSILRIDSSIKDIEAKAAAAPPIVPNISTAQPQVVGIGRREYEHGLMLHQDKIDQLQRKTDTLEEKVEANASSLQHLDSRYNNITSEHVAKSMLGQLHVLYPQVGNVQYEFEQLRNTQKMLQDQIQQLTDKVDKQSEFQNSSKIESGIDSDAIRSDMEKIHRTQDGQSSKLEKLEELIVSTRMNTAAELGKYSAQIDCLHTHCGLQPPEGSNEFENEE
ncbi:MAG: hypothetical protein M1840_000046 [Geoglossum simile]|nr:MAG: hypothetical protein M1840_000046 [Geoglossum simile]